MNSKLRKINPGFAAALFFLLFAALTPAAAQTDKTDEKAEAILKKAVANLGGDKYLNINSQISKGRFSLLRDGQVISFQSFVDVIVYPDRERTEFKGSGVKSIQTNTGDTGWIFDSGAETIIDQTAEQVENFRRGIRVSIDHLLRGAWRRQEGARLEYAGRRPASIGRRNDVVKLIYPDDFAVEFEFSDEGMPVKSIYKRLNPAGEEVTEEDRYAQFVDIKGVQVPFIVDHYVAGSQTSRINYEAVEFNKTISDDIFAKPGSVKEAKKDMKL